MTNTKTENLLPLGTLVYLEDGTKKIMIVGRGAVVEDEESGDDVYFDYMGCAYPEGIDPENAIFFNEENIDEILHKGYSDEEEQRFMKLYKDWENNLTIEKKMI
ncbi:DUF4176 domain-containing protein [Pueribacillus sp. YX66]|uniref:DUF4176 domain-containing protein n=1 Tax=Pueribacillus sp. YX66 TaxID=3229242 RepID=UPI00358D1659